MKPHELFREATQDYSRTIVLDGIVLRERQNRQIEGFRQRAVTIMDEVEFLAPAIRDGLDFEQFKPVRRNGSSEIQTVKRFFQFIVPAEDEFNQYAPEGTYFVKRIAIGTHDSLVKYAGEANFGLRSATQSCDIVTMLDLALEDGHDDPDIDVFANNPFEGFQTLERLDWEHPVFDSERCILPLEGSTFINAPIINTEAFVVAYYKGLLGNNTEGLIAGMHAALDDFTEYKTINGL
jgi:hypothetical protein